MPKELVEQCCSCPDCADRDDPCKMDCDAYEDPCHGCKEARLDAIEYDFEIRAAMGYC